MRKPLRKFILQPACNRAAFTLTELLVIVAVVAALTVVQVAAMSGPKGRTRIAQCATHLRQFAAALQMYAGDNNGRFPRGAVPPFTAPGAWPWDLAAVIVSNVAPYGVTRDALYCPANPDFNNDTTWNFGIVPSNPTGGFRIAGYVTALPDTPQLPGALANWTLTSQTYQSGPTNIPPQLPSQRVLLADVIISYNGNFGPIPIGGLPLTFIQRTSHMDGKLPEGGNVALLDGHVDWREFSDMKVKFGTPTFYW